MVCVSGGVSVGPHDHVKPALHELGVSERFWGVALRPGKPTWFGSRDDTLVFGLPGKPGLGHGHASCSSCGPRWPRCRATTPRAPRVSAVLDDPVRLLPTREQAVRVGLSLAADGWHAAPTGAQESAPPDLDAGSGGAGHGPARRGRGGPRHPRSRSSCCEATRPPAPARAPAPRAGARERSSPPSSRATTATAASAPSRWPRSPCRARSSTSSGPPSTSSASRARTGTFSRASRSESCGCSTRTPRARSWPSGGRSCCCAFALPSTTPRPSAGPSPGRSTGAYSWPRAAATAATCA